MKEDKFEPRYVVRAVIYAPVDAGVSDRLEGGLYRFSDRLTGLSVKESLRDSFVSVVLDGINAVCRFNGYCPSSVQTAPSADEDMVSVTISGEPAGVIHFITPRHEDPFRAVRQFLQEGGAS